MNPANYLILASILFAIGAVGVMVRRNALIVFMSVELMLNASVNLSFVAFSQMHGGLDGHAAGAGAGGLPGRSTRATSPSDSS